jgi:hypothetical protein
LNEWAQENRPPQFVVFKIVGAVVRRSLRCDLLTLGSLEFMMIRKRAALLRRVPASW